jgi:hypothetical protein
MSENRTINKDDVAIVIDEAGDVRVILPEGITSEPPWPSHVFLALGLAALMKEEPRDELTTLFRAQAPQGRPRDRSQNGAGSSETARPYGIDRSRARDKELTMVATIWRHINLTGDYAWGEAGFSQVAAPAWHSPRADGSARSLAYME